VGSLHRIQDLIIKEKNMRWFIRSKIHRATVTEANLDYIGSVTIDEELIEKTGILPGEKVLITSLTSGSRLETYVIAGPRGSGVFCMNGSAAHLIKKGEVVIVMGFELAETTIPAKVILVDEKNKFSEYLVY
jgi:aspartate 1-decarboxylase